MPTPQNQTTSQPNRGTNATQPAKTPQASAQPAPAQANVPAPENANHMSKDGTPDRRFQGQRDLPDETKEVNPNYTAAQPGGITADGTHITTDGKPDQRFKENRGLTEAEIKAKQIQTLQQQTAKPQAAQQAQPQQAQAPQNQQNAQNAQQAQQAMKGGAATKKP